MLKSINSVKEIRSKLVKSAQKVYDEWTVDRIEELNGGGICQDIADALLRCLYSNNIEDVKSICSNFEQHVFVIGKFEEGTFTIDIPHSIYERGSCYSWKKIPEVTFSEDDLVIERMSADPNDFDLCDE